MDADQNAQVTNQIYANIQWNSESTTMWSATEYTLDKRKMRKRAPQEQHHTFSHPQINKFHNPYRPANSAFENTPHKTIRSFSL